VKVVIHRGTQQIGGTCIELTADGGGRILLDLGRPLDVDDVSAAAALPAVGGLRDGAADLLAVLISHPHQDHVGLVEHVHRSIPVVIGPAGQRILDRAAAWMDKPLLSGRDTILHWQSERPVSIGPFLITPFLVDHSAYDAYALLIEADGERIFYSGDFRGHGRKSALFERLIARPPPNIDVLLMEGTVIGRDAASVDFPTEDDLEQDLAARLRAAQGLTLAWTSAQNIDRLVTMYRACRRTGKRFVVDAFTAEMLAATGNPKIPQADWEGVGVYVPQWMRLKIKRQQAFDLLESFKRNRVFLDALTRNDMLLFRPGMLKEVDAQAPLDGAQLIYSNWSGYLRDVSTEKVRNWLHERAIPMHVVHTSGHASIPDLVRFSRALAPKRLVPIHSFHTASFGSLFDNVDLRADGESWAVSQSSERQR
jgi:ribonuclease J